MKNWIILTFIILFSQLLQAQSLEINWGEQQKRGGPYTTQRILGGDDQQYYISYRPKKKNQLLQYDYNNQLLKESTNTIKLDGKNTTIKDVVTTQSGSYFIATNFSKLRKREKVLVVKTKEDGSPEGEPRVLFSYRRKHGDHRIRIAGLNNKNFDATGMALSPDLSKVLFTRVETAKDSRLKKEIHRLFVFDQAMKPLWEKEVTLPFKDKNINVEKFGISNNGEVFLTTKLENIRKTNGNYIVYKIGNNGKLIEMKVTLKGNSPIGVCAEIDSKGEVYVGGVYQKKDEAKGTYLIKYDAEGNEVFSTTEPWDDETRSVLRKANKGKRQYMNLTMGNFSIDEKHNSVSFVIERSGSFVNQVLSRGVIRYSSSHFFVPSFSLNGEFNWIAIIPRDFSTENYLTDSYLSFTNQGNRYLLFNYSSDYDPYIVKLNKHGEKVLSKGFDSTKIPVSYYFSKIVNNDTILFFGQNRQFYRIGTFNFSSLKE